MKKYSGSCHCGKVKFEVEMDMKNGIACNCSMCMRKGSILDFVPESQFHLLSGNDNLTDYQFGQKNIHHTFCKTCGVTAFATGKGRDGKPIKAINLRCLDGFNLTDVKINDYDGRSI